MKKIKDFVLNYFDNLSVGKSILAGLAAMVPVFLLTLMPSIIFYSMDNSIRYEKYPWLETFSWVWALSVFGVLFLTVVVYLIVTGIRDMKYNREFHKKFPDNN